MPFRALLVCVAFAGAAGFTAFPATASGRAQSSSGAVSLHASPNVIGSQLAEFFPDPLGAAFSQFGFSVAISGNTALVGDPYYPNGEIGDSCACTGEALVFTKSRRGWTETDQLIGSDSAAGDDFGFSVAISGGMLIVGAPHHQVGTNAAQGAAYVYVNTSSDGLWSQEAELTSDIGGFGGTANEVYGASVAISGTSAIVGAFGAYVSGVQVGAAYAYNESGGNWHPDGLLSSSIPGTFGGSVAISGKTAVVGAHTQQVGSNGGEGAAYVYTEHQDSWALAGELTPSDGGAEDSFGYSVAVSGTTVVVGSPDHQVGGNINQGSAYVFSKSGSAWPQTAELTASPDPAPYQNFGWSVSVTGSPHHSYTVLVSRVDIKIVYVPPCCTGYVYTGTGNTWTPAAEVEPSDAQAADSFGDSVSVSGTTALIGAELHQVGSVRGEGAAYVFSS
ncbi:MAG TPA: hypothetical protein VEJ87_15200 [Acidimicrobiales bacterium]|nr:hypothetical protein [Acidimicrobiales bacterium]